MTPGHVFVVASGFGKRIIPNAVPFTLRVDGDHKLAIGVGKQFATVEPGESVTNAAAEAVGVADVTAGPAWPAWWLETHLYRVPIPVGWTAHASGSTDPSVFDLVGPHDSMIYVQMPRHVLPIDDMVAPGQKVLDRGASAAGEWIAVSYTEGGQGYVQRHTLVRVEAVAAVVTLQCPTEAFSLVAPTHEFVADSCSR